MRISVPSEGCGRRHADAEERQRRLGDDRDGEVDRGDHQHRPQHVGQHVAQHDARAGGTPMTRAACTYSLLRSTSVEPRTVRAYCTQPRDADREDQHVDRDRRRGSPAAATPRTTPSISSAIRIAGKRQLHVGDAHDARRRRAADDSPRAGRARRRAPSRSSTDAKPTTKRDARAVHDRRQHVAALVVGAERKGPVAVPCIQAGGLKRVGEAERRRDRTGRAARSRARSSARDADEARPRAATIATGERRKLYQRSLSEARRAAGRRTGAARRRCRRSSRRRGCAPLEPQARIDRVSRAGRRQVDQHEDQRDQHR